MAHALNMKTKMTAAVLLLTAALLSVLAFSARAYFVEELKELLYKQQFTMLSAVADQADEKIAGMQTELVAAAGTLDTATINDPARIQRFFANRPDTLAMYDNGLFLFTAQGILIFENPPERSIIGKNYSYRPYLRQTLLSRAPLVSEPFVSSQPHQHPIVMFTAPVFAANGDVVAVLCGSLDLTKDNFLSRLVSTRLGDQGYLYLYSKQRVMIAHPDRSRVFKNDIPPGANRMLDKAVAGFEGTGETVTSRHKEVISSFKRLKTTGWILASNFPRNEAYAPLHRTERFILATLLVVFFLSFVVVWLCMRHLTKPLVAFTRQIRALTGKGDITQTRIQVESKDEIGVLGEAFNLLLDELAKQKRELQRQLQFSQSVIDATPVPVFYKDGEGRYLGCNKAFEEFTGCSREFVIGRTVYDIAPPENAQRYHAADAKLRQSKGLQVYETKVLHKDGSERDVVFFKTPFSIGDGDSAGLIGALMDISDSKQAQAALKAQKEFAESLVLNSSVATFVLDREHRVIIWNHACERLTGVMARDIIGSSQLWRVFYGQEHPLLADLVLEGTLDLASDYYTVYERSSLIQDGIYAETWYQGPEGASHYITITAAPIRDAAGNLIGAIETIQDLTDKKKAQDALEKTRRQLQLILDAAGEGIYGVDLDGRITFVNPASSQMVGWREEEMLGQNHHALIHHTKPDGSPYPEEECPITRAVAQGVPHQGPDLFWRKDGSSFHVEFISTPIRENGELVGAVAIFKDISERKQAEEQLHKLSQAVMQSPVSILITDTSGNIEYVNPKFTEISGYHAGEVIGKNPRLMRSGKTPDETYKKLWNTITSGLVWSGEIYNKHKSGETYWEHATISPIRNGAGVISHYMAFMENMTDRKRLEEQLRQAQKMEAIGQLAGGVAHDFNNILTVIMGFGQLMQHSLPKDDPKQGHMDQILDAADRASHLTKSLLAFSRKQVMLLQQVELNHLASRHTNFLIRIIGEDITLKTSFCEEPLTLMADGTQIEQVLMNLAANARDAMPEGGELSISTSSMVLGKEFQQQHGYGVPGRYAVITMTDTGSGMDRETQEKIFEPFFTTKAPGHGTGLGLSIVYGIVKQHSGYITIDSEVGAGTTFSIYLPLAKEQHDAVAKAPSFVPQGGKETILVVEDDAAVRRLVESVLKRFGYRVIVAESGDEAIELFQAQEEAVDLALLDVIMPKMNGKQVCEMLRERSPRLKVLFLSGYTADVIQGKGIQVDGIDLISKPAKPLELAKKVREMLDAA